MGRDFFDKYSLLHMAWGSLFRLAGVPLFITILTHIIFEIAENSVVGMEFINNNLSLWWPGGKDKKDSLINSGGDVAINAFGWILADLIFYR